MFIDKRADVVPVLIGTAFDKSEKYRAVLYFAAQFDLDPLLQGKLDLSGVVQQTL